jgi:hypothetical protein
MDWLNFSVDFVPLYPTSHPDCDSKRIEEFVQYPSSANEKQREMQIGNRL